MKQQTKESSVVVAFAELGRLERDRAEQAAAKQAVSDTLSRQRCELDLLRERLVDERPKAVARARRERARRERVREQLRVRLVAEAETAHTERLDLFRAELEAKRLRLAALEATATPERPSRRVLEWSIPVAATALVSLLAVALFSEEQAVAQPAAPMELVVEAPAAELPAELPKLVEAPIVEPEPEPVMVEPEPEPEPVKAKPKAKKKTTKKPAEPATKPVIKKNSKPLDLGSFDGNPLG